jgi:hypothetical protein
VDTEHSGHHYQTTRGSDVQRDGMFLELVVDGCTAAPVMEAFFSDATGTLRVELLERTSIPVEIVREFIGEAERLLPPVPQTS